MGATSNALNTVAQRVHCTFAMKNENVRIRDLDTNAVQPTARTASKGLGALKASLSRYGIMRPITVARVGKKLIVIDGHRTAAAWAELGHDTIPCCITDAKSTVEAEAAFAHMNVATSKMAGRSYLEQWARATDGNAHLLAIGTKATYIRALIKIVGAPAAKAYGLRGNVDPSIVNVVGLLQRTITCYRTAPSAEKICHWLILHRASVQARFVCAAGSATDVRRFAKAIDDNQPSKAGKKIRRSGARE
jgi:hypothetical protein